MAKTYSFPALKSYEWAFFLFFVYCYLNIGVLVTKFWHPPIPINIVFFVATFGFVLLKAPYKFCIKYFVWAYIFLALFAFGGFLGARAVLNYESFQSIFKHWITHMGIPWLAIVTIPRKHYNFYLKTLLVLGGIGGIFSLIQIPFFSVFEKIISSTSVRTAGFWVNPNNSAMMLLATLFMTGHVKSSSPKTVLSLRVLIILGIITSFSRTAIVLLFFGAIYYAYLMRQTKLVLATVAFGFLFVIGLIANMSSFSEHQQKRIKSVVQIASNDEVEADNRSALWFFASIAVWENDPILGLGHTSMDNIVPIGENGLGPHNYWIWIWGNSGLIGVIALLIYLIALFRMSLKLKDRSAKAATVNLVLIIFCYNILAHDVMAHQMSGVLTSMVALSVFFFSKQQKEDLEIEKVKG